MDESEHVERLVEEYRRLHIAMGALHLGLDIGDGSLGHDDSERCRIELEKLYMYLESLGAEGRAHQIEIKNEAILAARKKTSKLKGWVRQLGGPPHGSIRS